MRQIILDTETTGLNARLGDRIIEVGCIEMVNRRFTGNNWHRYLNPERAIEEGAKAVHGISEEFLADKPKFRDVATEFLEYIRGAELIIHNAAFDIEFLDAEFGRLAMGKVGDHGITVADTLKMARELHPGKRNSLDALCDRYEINNKHRTLHGALLDAELLAEVYVDLVGARQSQLLLASEREEIRVSAAGDVPRRQRLVPLAPRVSDAEREAHRAFIATMGEKAIWNEYLAAPVAPAG